MQHIQFPHYPWLQLCLRTFQLKRWPPDLTCQLGISSLLEIDFQRHVRSDVLLHGGHVVAACMSAWLQEEFLGATKLCKEIKRTDGGRTNWQRLFEPYNFFKSYKNYLQV